MDRFEVRSFLLPGANEEDSLLLFGQGVLMHNVIRLIGHAACTEDPVLITGESGTGKELTARTIHRSSQRHQKPFLTVNCSAFSSQSLESELFGHEINAFPEGTLQRTGKFELAHTGTILLSETSTMPLATQAKLVRFLKSGRFERLGGIQTLEVNVRIIASTNESLESAISEHRFRHDLFYQLNINRIDIPALRNRKDDIPAIARHFLTRLGKEREGDPRSLSDGALRALVAYHWPGNIPELQSVVRFAYGMAKSDSILPADLPPSINEFAQTTKPPYFSVGPDTEVSEIHHDLVAETDISALANKLFRWACANPKLKVLTVTSYKCILGRVVVDRGIVQSEDQLLRFLKLEVRHFPTVPELSVGPPL
jgi:DNA-binding NtrC family response regulator